MKLHLPKGLQIWLLATISTAIVASTIQIVQKGMSESNSRGVVTYKGADKAQQLEQPLHASMVERTGTVPVSFTLAATTQSPIKFVNYGMHATTMLTEDEEQPSVTTIRTSTDDSGEQLTTSTPSTSVISSTGTDNQPTLSGTITPSLLAEQGLSPIAAIAAAPGDTAVTYGLSGNTLTLTSGEDAAIRMRGADSDTTNSGRVGTNITYRNGSFYGGTTLNNRTITAINIQGGGALYLYNRGDGNDFQGTITISDATGDMAVIGTYNTTAADLQIDTLKGSGNLLLRGHNTNTNNISSFTFTNNEFAGTVYMTANGGRVQVNAAGTGWAQAVFDFTRNAAYSNSLIDSSGSAPAKQTLNLTADATVAGLHNGSSTYAVLAGNNHTLTVGKDSSDTYTYRGAISNLSGLTKVGSNTQEISQSADIATVTVNNGTLGFTAELKSSALNLTGGTLSTQQATIGTANLTGGSTWELGSNVSPSELNLTAGNGSVTLSGQNVTFNAPSTINFSGYSAESSSPIFTLNGTTLDLTGSTLNFEGTDLAGVSTLNFAELSNGGSYTFGNGSITVTAGGTSYEATLTTNGSMLQLVFGNTTEVVSGSILWVNTDSSGKPTDGLSSASYSTNGWSGTAMNANDLRSLNLAGGGEVYLHSEETAAAYTGNIELTGGSTPALVHSDTQNAAWELSGSLGGSGNLRLVGHYTDGATIFTPTRADIAGSLSAAGARGGDVQLNLSGNMQSTVADLNAYVQDSIYTATEETTRGRTIVTLEGDTALKGISGTDARANLAATQNGANLTIGTSESGSNYSYAGTIGADYYTNTTSTAAAGKLNLTKIGSNTQHFEQDATLGSLSQQGGTLSFGGQLHAESLTLQSGTLSTLGNVNLGAATLYGGTTWELGRNWNSSNTTLNFRKLNAAPVNFTGNGATWTLSQDIQLADSGLSNYSAALFSLDGVNLNLGNSFTLSGIQSDLSAGDSIVLAHLSNGAVVSAAADTIRLNGGEYLARLNMVDNQAVLTITAVPQTVRNGQYMWIHRFENETGHTNGEMEGILGGTYSNNTWTGDTYISDQSKLSNIRLEQGAQLYLRDGAMNGGSINFDRSNTVYEGNITILESGGDSPAQIHSEGKTWAVWNFTGQLSGSGELQLVSHGQDSNWNRWDTVFNFSNFNDEEGWFDGTVSMLSLRGGPVQLNIGRENSRDLRWANSIIDLSNPDPSQTSIYDTSSSDRATGVVLGLVGDATIKGLTATVGGDANYAVGVSTNITAGGQSHTLTLGTDSGENFTFGGTLGYDRFYRGGNGTPGEGGSDYLASAAGSLNLTKIGSNTQTFTGSSVLGEITIQNGTLQFDGDLTASVLTLQGGTFINNNTFNGLHIANLSSSAAWQMGTDTTTNAVVFNLSGLNSSNFTITGTGNGVTWTMGGDLVLSNSGRTGSPDTPFFTLDNVGLTIGSFLTVQGVKLGAGVDRIALFDLNGGSFSYGDNELAGLTTIDGTSYKGKLYEENGIVYIGTLEPDTEWPTPMNPQTGYIWSGEPSNTSPGGYDHRTLVLGHIWRADGQAENTGWHEQALGGKNPGVYVNGNAVTFADSNLHGDRVESEGRTVDIRGQVAPGIIYVTANENLASVSNGGEAQMMYAYAFTSEDNSGKIVDVTDTEGNILQATKIVKTGTGLLVLNTSDNTFSGGIDVLQGGLYLASVGATGTGALTFHSDGKWEMPVYANIAADGSSQGGNGSWKMEEKVGGELMVCYLHSNEHASGYRSPTVSNDIFIAPTADGSGGRFTISFGTSSFVYTTSGNSDINNVPRHWRNLTLNGALISSGNSDDVLVLTGYSSNWLKYHDQSYVTSFTLNEDKKLTTQESNFNGTVVLKNTINTSPLYSNLLETRTAGTVQVMLRDDKFQHAIIDLSREMVTQAELAAMGINDTGDRMTYNSILVLTGEVGLRGLSAEFRGSGYIFPHAEEAREALSDRYYVEDLAQNDEVWHVRTVANATSTLRIGENEFNEDAVYVYSGALGFAQSYTEPTESHLQWGDGFDTPPTDDSDAFVAEAKNRYHMGLETLSLIKQSDSEQYIHTALLNDVSLYDGVLGFNNLELRGNMSLVGGSNLKLGVTGTVGNQTWDYIAPGTTSDHKTQTERNYAVSPTSSDITVLDGKKLTVYTPEPSVAPGSAGYLPQAAIVDGNITMSSGSGLYFEVERVEPWFHEFTDGKTLSDYTASNPLPTGTHGPSGNMLLDVNGTLDLMSNTADMELRFRGVNFSLTPFSDRLYYLAEADNITVGGDGDSSAFSSRLISLGYGYFGLVDTLDSSDAAHNTNGKDYLVMSVLGDPRHTWSGAVELTDDSFEWISYTDNTDNMPRYDYHWKENTAFMNGHVVLFGNLYNPRDWEQEAQLTSDESVRVLTRGTIATDKGSDLDGHDVLLSGTVAISELEVNSLNEHARFGTDYQKVHINGEVAPLSIIINSEYLDVTDGQSEIVTEDGTNYWFYGENGTIRDATPTELSDMFEDYEFDGGEWKTNLEKYGSGTAVISTSNSFTGGTKLYGGKIVMQHYNALGQGGIMITNGATLQGDFADDRNTDHGWPYGDSAAFVGEGMDTSTVNGTLEVRLNVNPDGTESEDDVDARLSNAVDKKMVLAELHGDSGAVVTLHGYSAPETAEQGMFASDVWHVGDSDRPAFTYAIFKVLDPSNFYGTIRMDGNIWGQPEGTDGGKVQLEIMTSAKADVSTEETTKDWLTTTIDLSVNNGTERTVLALDAIEGPDQPTTQEAYINSLNGTEGTRMADGAINSSVVNMSENTNVTLVIEGMSSGDYDGVLGYGDFQRTTDYSSEGVTYRDDVPAVGEVCHHYGNASFGTLNVLKKGAGTTQSVYNAWLNKLTVQGGVFAVDHALLASEISSGAGQRVFVGDVQNLSTIYALTVGENGILGMDTEMFNEDGSKHDAWESIQAGVPADNVGWVQLEDGATLTAHRDWYTDTQIDIRTGAAVTFNAHNFTPDPYITSDHSQHDHIDEDSTAHEHFNHFNSSHIIQMLGNFTGQNVNLTFTNEQISPGANATELGGSDYMGYIAINDHNSMTGELRVEEQTVLQVLQNNSSAAAMNATIDGTDAALQMVHGRSQYVNSLSVRNKGAMLLGGAEKTSLGTGNAALKTIDYAAEGIQLSVTHRGTSTGTMSTVYSDTRSDNSYYLGGTDARRSEAQSVHITVHDASATTGNYVHDINLHNVLVEMENSCTVNLADSVLIDKNSIVFGNEGEFFNSDIYSLSASIGTIEDFETIAPKVMSETAYVSKNTTVEMTMAGDRATYSSGGKTVYTVKTDQFQGTNVDNMSGSGLTIKLQQDIIGQAYGAGADVIAIQIGGNQTGNFSDVNGRFLFETAAGTFEMSDSERLMYDVHGTDITAKWIDSATLYEQFGIQGSQNMLYIVVPEPATATLSLLALAALAARRRRK